MRVRGWICAFMLSSKGDSDSCLWLTASAWQDFWVFPLSFKGNSLPQGFLPKLLLLSFITSVFTLPSKDEDEEADHKTEADPGRLDQMVHPMAERLDILLSLLLSYIKDVCYVDGNSLQ